MVKRLSLVLALAAAVLGAVAGPAAAAPSGAHAGGAHPSIIMKCDEFGHCSPL